MKILPINNSNNQISHKVVNKKFLDKAIELNKKYGNKPPLGGLLQEIDIDLAFGFLNKQDAIDTLKEIKLYAKNATKAIDDTIEKLKKWKD